MAEDLTAHSLPGQALLCAADADIRAALREALHHLQWQVECCEYPDELISSASAQAPRWQFVMLVPSPAADIRQMLEAFQPAIRSEQTCVVIISARPSAAEAMLCTRLGAMAYLSWPVLPSALTELAQRAQRITITTAQRAAGEKSPEKSASGMARMIGASGAMLELSVQLVRIARAQDLSVFINGETGSGKEVIARQLQQESGRRGAFHAINCSAMAESLLESELFGHERGSFTGAHATRKGLWEEAADGTLFLDEITEASPALQAKLLRVMQEGVIRRVGSNREITVTARIIAASNRDLQQAIREKTFREDLYYRFREMLRVPPLRERAEDIPLLVEYFTQRTGRSLIVTPEAMKLLCEYHWPGNVRELENLIIRLAAHCGSRIFAEDLKRFLNLHSEPDPRPSQIVVREVLRAVATGNWLTSRQLRNRYITEAYRYFGSVRVVAIKLDMDYRTVINALAEEGISLLSDGTQTDPVSGSPESSGI